MNSRESRVNLALGDGEPARGKKALPHFGVCCLSFHADGSLHCYVQIGWGGGKGAMGRQV